MIPNKIYVGVGTLSSIQPAEEYVFPGWQEKAYSQIRNEQYIRKDALLEWLQEARAVPHDGALIRDRAFQEIINYINEM